MTEQGAEAADLTVFAPWLAAWRLVADGPPFETAYTGSRLLPVLRDGRRCMLKVASDPDEIRGAALMAWWNGRGAAKVLERDGAAILLERAQSAAGVSDLSRSGADVRAMEILCTTLKALHEPCGRPPPSGLRPLKPWFASLEVKAADDGRLSAAWKLAQDLLSTPADEVVLHGDMHHENVLDFGARGWLAIDPKGLIGERAYDYANILRNPDAETALAPGRLEHRLQQVSTAAGLDPRRLTCWVVAYAGLSAAWSLIDGQDPAWSYAVLEAALARLKWATAAVGAYVELA